MLASGHFRPNQQCHLPADFRVVESRPFESGPTTSGMQAVLKAQTHRTRLGCAQPDAAKRAEGVPLRPPDREGAAPRTPKSFRRWAASTPSGFGMRHLHRHWPGINPPLLQTAALPAGQLMEQGGEPCAEQKL
jgi:hypothetical protein